MANHEEESPTIEEISTILQELGVEEAVVADAIGIAVERRREEQDEKRWDSAVYGLAQSDKRTVPGANDSNIEGWFETMSGAAHSILKQAPSLAKKPRSKHRQLNCPREFICMKL